MPHHQKVGLPTLYFSSVMVGFRKESVYDQGQDLIYHQDWGSYCDQSAAVLEGVRWRRGGCGP